MTSEEFFKKDKRRTRITAVVLAFSVVINLLFLMYAFVQKAEADALRNQAANDQRIAVGLEKMTRGKLLETEKALQDTIRVTQRLREELSKKKK